ncbi:hypothetical protein [Shewanella dokdonensis]|uniref:Lipoprotein n=1 Tax=Shewanella dokdonensis TaxID=712036 RepID=A0ABX8DFD9_9GAMM|nr:hypothetical protein [Shewanella dokdonensis]MCL1075021.1 hypothetical protein [Shewanella dokdonensis]QVK23444.1 hypothetical protein KHX94_01230 [Shewanella dokdonensis]
MRYVIFFCMICLFGCSDAAKDGEASPEQIALGFFQAIYVDRDVEKATQYVDAPIKDVLRSYYIAQSVQRYMLNLSMTDVTLSIEDIDIDFFRKFSDEVTVVVKLVGKKAGEKWIDDRTLKLKRRGNSWIIIEVVPETGKTNVGAF